MQNAVFYNKICNVILINHTFWQVWNILRLTKCIMLCIYIYFAIKLLFCQTHVWGKTSQIQCSSILSTRTQYGASVQLPGGGGVGYFIKFSVPAYSTRKKKWTQSDLSFCKNEGSSNLKLMEKGVNWIENEGRIDTKCLKSVKWYILVKYYTNFRP